MPMLAYICHPSRLFGPLLQNINPNFNLFFGVTLKCNCILSRVYSYRGTSPVPAQNSISWAVKSHLFVCILTQQSQHSWVLFLLKLPQQPCLLTCHQFRAAGLTQHLFVSGDRSHQASLTGVQATRLDPISIPRAGAGSKPNYLSTSTSIRAQKSLKANMCQDP